MIRSYRDKRTKAFADGERVKAFSGIERQGWKRLVGPVYPRMNP